MSRVTSGNNKVKQHFSSSHKGIDICHSANEANNKVLAHSSGTVVETQTGQKNNPGSTGLKSYGNYIRLKHSAVYKTRYAHLDKLYVKNGDHVEKGQVIGIIGNTGNSYGRHLHWELSKLGVRIDPEPYLYSDLPGSASDITYQTWDCKKKKWLPNVKAGSNDYAGNKGNAVGAIYIDNLKYRAHDMNRKKWLPWVEGRSDFAGNKTPIDGIQIENATYRVYDNKKKKWLPWVTGTVDYAGNIGNAIGAVQIKKN